MRNVCDQDTSDSESSCAPIGQSKYSLSSALSTDSLRGELSLPDLLIQEPEEEEELRKEDLRRQESKDPRQPPGADVFVSVSADQLFAAAQPRTTDDLFAVIHSAVWEGTA